MADVLAPRGGRRSGSTWRSPTGSADGPAGRPGRRGGGSWPGWRPGRRGRAPADPPFDPTTDLKLTLNFRGPGITPDFFQYPLDDVAGRVRFDGKEVRVEQMTAVHGESKWGLAAGEVRLYDAGQVWANLGRLEVNPLVADAAFWTPCRGKLKAAVAGSSNSAARRR